MKYLPMPFEPGCIGIKKLKNHIVMSLLGMIFSNSKGFLSEMRCYCLEVRGGVDFIGPSAIRYAKTSEVVRTQFLNEGRKPNV